MLVALLVHISLRSLLLAISSSCSFTMNKNKLKGSSWPHS